MTKTNAEATVAEQQSPKRRKIVLTEEDMLPKGGETQAAQKKRVARELAMEAQRDGTRRAAEVERSAAIRKGEIEPTKEREGMARGLSNRDAPHSAKSLYDHRRTEKASGKADARQARLAKEVQAKAARAARAAPKADDTRKITILDKNYTFGREGSARNASWAACTKAKTVADYAKAGGALKYLPRWVAAKAIKLG